MRASTVPVRYDPMPAFRYAHKIDGRPLHPSGSVNCPLCNSNGCYSHNEFSRQVGFSATTMSQWLKRGGITEETADRIATTLGLHPSLLWPEWWSNLELIEQWEAEKKERRRRQDREAKERRKKAARRPRLEAAVEAMFAKESA